MFKIEIYRYIIKETMLNLKKINIKRMASEIPTNLLKIIIFHFSDIFIISKYKKYCHKVENELKKLLFI